MESGDASEVEGNQRGKRKQLKAGMEHLRCAVTVPEPPLSTPSSDVEESDAYGVPARFQPVRKPRTDASNNAQKRTDPFQFGSRYLEEGDDIFEYNAWDHVETDEAYREFAEEQYAKQRQDPVNDFDKKRFSENPERWWNKFYQNNTANFFKNRKWLQQEFPILGQITQPDSPPTLILEVGAGAGNTAFPILAQNKNPNLKIHACDFSKKAVELIRTNPLFESPGVVGSIDTSVWDVVSPVDADSGKAQLPLGIEPETVDVVILIFIFSALAPKQWQQAMRNIWAALKPGGVVLFRDYGRGDLAQVRFKKGRYLDENFYIRGDGTRVYFFDEDELRRLWSGDESMTPDAGSNRDCVEQMSSGLSSVRLSSNLDPSLDEPTGGPSFDILNFGVDRRMLVNRQRRLKMYRCWMQGLFRKPFVTSVAEASKTTVKSAVELPAASTSAINIPIVEESGPAVSPL